MGAKNRRKREQAKAVGEEPAEIKLDAQRLRDLGLLSVHGRSVRETLAEMIPIRPTAVQGFRQRRMLTKLMLGGANVVVGGQKLDPKQELEGEFEDEN